MSRSARPGRAASGGSSTTGRLTPTATSTWEHLLNKTLKDFVVRSLTMRGL